MQLDLNFCAAEKDFRYSKTIVRALGLSDKPMWSPNYACRHYVSCIRPSVFTIVCPFVHQFFRLWPFVLSAITSSVQDRHTTKLQVKYIYINLHKFISIMMYIYQNKYVCTYIIIYNIHILYMFWGMKIYFLLRSKPPIISIHMFVYTCYKG